MKRKAYLLSQCMSALMLLTVSSCQSDDKATGDAKGHLVDIEASIGTATRVTYNGKAAEFADGDCLTLLRLPKDGTPDLGSNSTNEQALFTLANGKWSSSPLLYWYDEQTEYDFYAIYPAITSSDDINDMSLKGNVVSDDIMFANKKNHSYSDGKVSLAFSHAMAKLVVNLKNIANEVNNTGNLTVTVKNAQTHYSMSISDMTISAKGTTSDLQLTKQQDGSLTYSLLLPPQNEVTTIVVNDGTRTFTWTNTSALSLVAGKMTTVTLNVGENYVLFGSVSVENWTPSTISGGEIEEPEER